MGTTDLSARSGLVYGGRPHERMRNVGGKRRTGTNALIDIHTSSFRVPNATLREKVPVDVEFPDTRCIADDSRHDGEYEDLTDDGRG
jgi:hypothetical protein